MGKYKEAEDAYRTCVDLAKDQQLGDTARAGVIKSLVDALEWDKATAECQKYLKQSKTKEQKAYFQTMLKKVKEAKAGPPAEKEEETPPIVPAPAPAQASASTTVTPPSSTAPAPTFIGPVAPTPSPQVPADSGTPTQAPQPPASPPQSPPPAAQPVAPKVPGIMPKTSMPSV